MGHLMHITAQRFDTLNDDISPQCYFKEFQFLCGDLWAKEEILQLFKIKTNKTPVRAVYVEQYNEPLV